MNENIENDFIWFSQSFMKTLMLFALKKDDQLQLCVDYYELNVVIVKNCYSLLLIDEIINYLNETKIFTKINIKNVYYWICIHKDNEWKTVFWTQYELYKYLMMFFKQINASATFQLYIHKVLHKHLNMFMIVFLNDILIYFKNEINHQQHVHTVLQVLLWTELYTKLAKCHFSVKKIFFVKFVITDQDIDMKEKHIVTVVDWSKLESIFEIQSFIDFVNFYRRFIDEFFCIVVRLMSMLKNSEDVFKKK